MATVLSSGNGGWATNSDDPASPASSPEKSATTNVRRSAARPVARARRAAASIAETVPEALSSAPLCTARASGRSEP